MYQLEMGSFEEGIVNQAISQKTDIPDRVLNQPILMSGLELFFKGFLDLTSDRLSAFELGPIPTMAILSYASYYDIDSSDFLKVIRDMDNAFIKYHTNKQKRERDRAERAAKRRK